MSTRAQLKAIRKAAPPTPAPQIIAQQDLDDPDIFHASDRDYTTAELDELAQTATVIRIVYTRDWRGVDDAQ